MTHRPQLEGLAGQEPDRDPRRLPGFRRLVAQRDRRRPETWLAVDRVEQLDRLRDPPGLFLLLLQGLGKLIPRGDLGGLLDVQRGVAPGRIVPRLQEHAEAGMRLHGPGCPQGRADDLCPRLLTGAVVDRHTAGLHRPEIGDTADVRQPARIRWHHASGRGAARNQFRFVWRERDKSRAAGHLNLFTQRIQQGL